MDEPVAKSAIEPSTGGASFNSYKFMAPKYTGGLCPILKHFKCYRYMPTYKMPTIKQVQQLIQQGDFVLCIDLRDAYLHIPIVKHHHHI